MTFNYGIIGNCRSAALVSDKASIDWACFPRFDSPSVFAKLLDSSKGGSCEIVPVGKYQTEQKYIAKTNILETRFYNASSEFSVFDFFPRYRYGERIEKLQQITRYIKVVRGAPRVRIIFNPRMNYAHGRTTIRIFSDYGMARYKENRFYIYSDIDLRKIVNHSIIALSSEHYIVLSFNEHPKTSLKRVKLLLARTKSYWLDFVRFSTLPSKYTGVVVRSILALKLLTHEGGAIVAAPTTSLPEIIGEQRNWDYRYCWLRDASFTVDALTKICHFDEAATFIEWLTRICRHARRDLQIVYRVDGDKSVREKSLLYLKGYRNSRPVRIGNRAWLQRQLDVYGEIMEAFYLFFHHYNYAEVERHHWAAITKIISAVVGQWQQEDSGLWEFRNTKKHFTFSKLMCWVAMDRAVKMARRARKADLVKSWKTVRDEIRASILRNAWNPKLQAFTQFYGSDVLDASNLLIPYFGFLPATHPRMRKTIMATLKTLVRNGFAFRYLAEDDFGMPKNAFSVCTFWLIDALYLIGEKELAVRMFDNILGRGNYLGLFSENINPDTYELTGNFPQAYTHLAIINTAMLLSTGQLRRQSCNIHFEMLRD
ncbi:glycoside hydrolase family 15 protein [Candidatus Woesearchaeota archaeon]|nr:glycoside hydrolase family 15 protein [Candidatus Woesearchaeota archaeon]